MELIEGFAEKAIASGAFQPMDKIYVMNKIRALVGDEDAEAQLDTPLASQLVELAVQRGKIEDGQTAREILNDQLYDLLTPTPAKVNGTFWQKHEQSPQQATDWFYDLCTSNDYVKVSAIKKSMMATSWRLRSIFPSPKKILRRLLLLPMILKRSIRSARFVWKMKDIWDVWGMLPAATTASFA